jgi:RNA polymerase primary sigma factor
MDDVLELFPEAEEDLPEIEDLMTSLHASGIEIIMPAEQEVREGRAGAEEPLREQAKHSSDLTKIDSHDSISLYFQQMDTVPLLTREEEVTLAKRMERGRIAQRCLEKGGQKPPLRRQYLRQVQMGHDARAHLIKANTRLVVSIAKRYIGLGVPFLDLIQEGNLGLMTAVDKFDYRRGCKLSTYATWWIRQSITRALSQQGRVIRLPSSVGYRIRKLHKTAQQLQQRTGKRPTPKEIAARLGVSPVRVRWLIKVAHRPLSLHKPVGQEGDSELRHLIEDEESPAPVEEATAKLMAEEVERLLSTLTPRQELILRMRFGLGNEPELSLREVAAKFGLTPQRIRQIQRQALRRLRHPSRSRHLWSYWH